MLPGMATAAVSMRSRRAAVVVTTRATLIALIAIAIGAVHLPGRPRTLCTLRAVTGVPCPFCGGTTAAVDLGHAQWGAALAASPLAVLLAVVLPFRGVLPRPMLASWWPRLTTGRATRWAVVATVLAAAEMWQLHRFHVLPF
jgi:hypothetical protein